MLTPDDSIVAIMAISSSAAASDCTKETSRIIQCAHLLAIPTLNVTYSHVASISTLHRSVSLVSGHASALEFEPEVEEWQGTKLAETLLATGRRQLLICGKWLEEGVSLLALRAMRAGVDAHVCVDASPALHSDQMPILLARLVQHNVVVTTSEQVVREWLALSSSDRRSAAQQVLDEILRNS